MLQKPGSVCRGLSLGILPGEFCLSLLTGLNLSPLCVHATPLTALSIIKVQTYLLLPGVNPSEAAWTLFVFISFGLFHVLSILVAVV